METNIPKTLRDRLARREDFIRVVVIGAVIALGINLLSVGISQLLPIDKPITLIVGAVVTTLSLLYLSKFIFGERHIGTAFKAFIVFDPVKKRIVPVREYAFSEEVYRAIRASFLENKALEAHWENEPLTKERMTNKKSDSNNSDANIETKKEADNISGTGDIFAFVSRQDSSTIEKMPEPKAASILREAIEFVVLERLSLTLSEYFRSYADDDRYIKEYIRDDVPALLLQNRILSLLTTPLENRAVFLKQLSKNPPKGEITLALGPDGAMYSRFDLVLPKNTKITRPDPGVLHLENERLELTLTTLYEGFWTSLPFDFIGFYVGYDPNKVATLQVNIKVDAKIKTWGLFRTLGWEYFRWVDSFMEAVEKFASEDAFFSRINWNALSAHLYVISRQRPVVNRTPLNKQEVAEGVESKGQDS